MVRPLGSTDGSAPQLQHALERVGGMSDRQLGFFSIDHHLKDINRYGRLAGDIGAAAIRPVVRRVLLIKPPFSRDAGYILDKMADLAYSPDELDVVNNAKQAAEARKAATEEAIGNGDDPWLAHAKHNERDVFNPLAVGFYQDDRGKMRTLYGPRHFLSKRQIEYNIFGGRAEAKEVNLLEGKFTAVEPTEVLKGTYWEAIPEDLRNHFENGEILVTTGNDLYAPSASDTAMLAESDDPNGVANLVDKKVREAESDGKYFLLYYSDYGGDDTGRTAVVTTIVDGELKPVLVEVGDKEFVVEVKGCGTKIGGFKGMQFRTGRDIITGGAEAEQARTEFYRLEDDNREGAPKAVGSIIFDNPEEQVFADTTSKTKKPYEQGYVIRLTPSTVRASFTGNEVYPDIEAPEFVDRILQIYASQLVEHVFSESPKILDRSSHTENILIWNNGNSTFTDYSDHVAFSDPSFPHYENHGGYMTPKQMLEYYVEMVKEIPGYGREGDRQRYYSHLQRSLAEHGVEVRFQETDDVNSITEKIWKGGMAYQVYKGRKQGQYFPEGVLNDFWGTFTSEFAGRGVPRGSREELVAAEVQARENLGKIIDFYKNHPQVVTPEDLDLDELSTRVADAPLTELAPLSDRLSQILYKNDNYENLSEEEGEWVRNRLGFYGGFDYAMVHTIRNYFEHELDVIGSALLSCPNAERAELEDAEAEVKAKVEMLTTTLNSDLAGYFDLVSTPDSVRRFLSLSYYTK